LASFRHRIRILSRLPYPPSRTMCDPEAPSYPRSRISPSHRVYEHCNSIVWIDFHNATFLFSRVRAATLSVVTSLTASLTPARADVVAKNGTFIPKSFSNAVSSPLTDFALFVPVRNLTTTRNLRLSVQHVKLGGE
jgi:hypothetical protein